MRFRKIMILILKSSDNVIPAKAGIHGSPPQFIPHLMQDEDDISSKICLIDLEKNKMKSIICLIFCAILFTTLSAQVTTDMGNENGENQNFIGVQGFTVNSIIHFKDSWKDATGFYASYGSISTSNQWALMFQTGYFSFNANPDAGFTGDEHFEIIPLQVGTRFYIALDRFRPFLFAMSGLNIINAKYKVIVHSQEGGEEEVDIDGSKIKANFQVGLGLGILLFSNLEIEGQFKYNSHLIEPSLPYNITGLEYGVALNWYLR
jgi:opacity protein-like surface antigen